MYQMTQISNCGACNYVFKKTIGNIVQNTHICTDINEGKISQGGLYNSCFID